MKSIQEATVLIDKCGECRKMYGIRTEKRDVDEWYCTWAFPIEEKHARNEKYTDNKVVGSIYMDEDYPGCPYCGGESWVQCGECDSLTCWGHEREMENPEFTCAWCDHTSEVVSADTFELNGNAL